MEIAIDIFFDSGGLVKVLNCQLYNEVYSYHYYASRTLWFLSVFAGLIDAESIFVTVFGMPKKLTSLGFNVIIGCLCSFVLLEVLPS